MSNPSITPSTSPIGPPPANTNFQMMREGLAPLGSTDNLPSSLREFIRKSRYQRKFKMIVRIVAAENTTVEMPAVLRDENLSAEDREAREKGLALAAHIEHLYRTDEGFRRWYHEGIDEIEAGHFVTFSEDGWKEE